MIFRKSLIYDKKNDFECLLIESQRDKNHYLAHNQVKESFSSTIFTFSRSTKDLSRAYLDRIQNFNAVKKIAQRLESELKMDYVNLWIVGPCAWMFSETGGELVPACLVPMKTSPPDDIEFFRICQLEIIAWVKYTKTHLRIETPKSLKWVKSVKKK